MQVVSVNQFRAKLKSVVDKAAAEHEPVRVTRKRGKNFVVLSEEDFDADQETLFVLQNQSLMKQIAESLKSESKKVLSKEEASAEFGI